MHIKSKVLKGLLLALVLVLIPTVKLSAGAAGPQTHSCGNYKVTTNEVIAGVKFPKGTYQINTFGISCAKVMGSKGLFAKFLKLKDKDPLPKPWVYLADAIGAPKFSSGPGVGFRVQLLGPTPRMSPTPTPTAIGDPVGAVGGTPSPTPTPTPTPTPSPTPTAEPIVLPTTFENLYERRKGISLAAWQKSSEVIKASKNKSGAFEIITGPNTTPNFDDYPTPISLVSRLFPARSEPAKTIVIRYKYVDLEWAETTLRSKLTAEEFTQLNRNEGGKAIAGRCDVSSRNCRGAMQQTTIAGLSLIIQGVPNEVDKNDPTSKLRFGSGMLEAHEYFHSLQRIPIMGAEVWPHAWFREGSAEWVQNMAVNYNDYKTYQEFLAIDCAGHCARLSEADIVEFLENSKENYTPPKFDTGLNYNLSSRFIEALVALKGPDIVIDLYEQMGKRLTFEQGFKNIFGVEWSYALPILAKTIYSNLKD